jgi:hypothetical protein
MMTRNNNAMLQNILLSFIILCGWSAGNAERFALIVGCNNGGETAPRLKYAEKDAREFADILQKFGGFASNGIHTVLGPDSGDVARQLAAMDSLCKLDKDPNGLFLFYYSGHADEENLLLGSQKFPLKKIRGFFDDVRSSVKVGIFDACNSGAITTFKGGKRAEPIYFQPWQNIKGQIIIASSAATEGAQESATLKGSVFSHHWFNGLRGSADFLGNGNITINEAYQYAYRKTIETTALLAGEVQHPVYKFDIFGQGDIVLTRLSKADGGVVFDRSCAGKFLVLSDDYIDVFADFSKKKGNEMFIALGQGDYTVINAVGKDIGTHSFTLKGNAFRMSENMLALTPISATNKKGPNLKHGSNEKETAPLSVYGWGVGARYLLLFTEKGGERQLYGLTFNNEVYMNERCNLFFNFYWLLPGINAGADIGFDYLFKADEKPGFFVGSGIGAYYLDNSGNRFSQRMGAGFTVHAGYSVDLSSRTQLYFQLPYTFVAGPNSHVVGLAVHCIFSGPYKEVKVLHE